MRTYSKNMNHTVVELVTITKPAFQSYAVVKSKLGNGRFMATLANGQDKTVTLTGRLRRNKRNHFVNPGDLILIERDGYNERKPVYYVLLKYTEDEKNKLIKLGEKVDCKTEKTENSENFFGNDNEENNEENDCDYIDNI